MASFKERSVEKLGDEASEVLILGPVDFHHSIVNITYCLSKPTSFRLRPDNKEAGFTRGELALSISKVYQKIYRVEQETMPEMSARRAGAFIMNRGLTHGKYGIHMHDLEDLLLHTAYYDMESHRMSLGIDS